MAQLHAGVARCDITPPIGIAQGNWSAQSHERAEGVDLPLMCTALAIADGTEAVIIAEWDLLYPPTAEDLARLEALKRNLAELRERGAPTEEIRGANRLARRATLDLFVAHQRSQGSSLTIEIQAIRIGTCALVGIPVEPFAAIGAQVKALSPFATTFFSGYTNSAGIRDKGLGIERSDAQSLILNPEYLAWKCTRPRRPGQSHGWRPVGQTRP